MFICKKKVEGISPRSGEAALLQAVFTQLMADAYYYLRTGKCKNDGHVKEEHQKRLLAQLKSDMEKFGVTWEDVRKYANEREL